MRAMPRVWSYDVQRGQILVRNDRYRTQFFDSAEPHPTRIDREAGEQGEISKEVQGDFDVVKAMDSLVVRLWKIAWNKLEEFQFLSVLEEE